METSSSISIHSDLFLFLVSSTAGAPSVMMASERRVMTPMLPSNWPPFLRPSTVAVLGDLTVNLVRRKHFYFKMHTAYNAVCCLSVMISIDNCILKCYVGPLIKLSIEIITLKTAHDVYNYSEVYRICPNVNVTHV